MVAQSVAALLSLALLVAGNPLSTHPDVGSARRPYPFTFAPLYVPPVPQSRLVNNSYIVVLKHDLPPPQLQLHINMVAGNGLGDSLLEKDGGLRHVYMMDGFVGYAGSFQEDSLNFLRGQPEVAFIERSQIFHTMGGAVQKDAPWGLARISHRKRLTLGNFRTYEYDEDGGEGVNVYVIDTGIFIKHEEFEGRARWGKTMPKNDVDEDGNGHGTHCAGTIASAKYGVAKKANVIAVKVLGSNGSGSTEDVVGGVVWAVNDALAQKAKAEEELRLTGKTNYKGSVANMSLGGGKSSPLDAAVNAAVKAGVHFAVAAGNENQDACNSSPAGATGPLTVGASTNGDERAYFSNHGPCVDVFAPGLNIKSTWNGPAKDATNIISGTSMASPHTAGLMAYLLSIYPSITFNPPIGKVVAEEPASSLFFNNPTYQSLLRVAKATFPRWMVAPLPNPSFATAAAPVPLPTMNTELMKKAVLTLSTQGALKLLPAQTVNLLIFNNATGIMDSTEEFWKGL